MEFDLNKPYCRFFYEITQIPHASGNEKALSDRLVAFAQERGLRWVQDASRNVVIYKDASPGYEDHPGVIIQAHMDMVAAKVPGSDHDFDRDPLKLHVEGTLLKADGTTLGADDGMGVAYMLAVLDDNSLPHPRLECCFTTGEEVGLTGALALKPEYFSARRLINLDGAGETITYMSMGGGQQAVLTKELPREACADPVYAVSVGGLLGGHSGGKIGEGRANAAKLLSRVLLFLQRGGVRFRLVSFAGGERHNIIMPSAAAGIATAEDPETLRNLLRKAGEDLAAEYEFTDPGVTVSLEEAANPGTCIAEPAGTDLVRLIYLLPYGMLARNLNFGGDVPVTSANIGKVRTDGEEAEIVCSVRSSMESAIREQSDRIALLAGLFGADVRFTGYYPGWKYDPDSPMRETLREVFRRLYGKELRCLFGHGGNECGVFKKMFPDMDIVTSGAIYGNIHSPDEYLDLESFDRSWVLLTEYLKAL